MSACLCVFMCVYFYKCLCVSVCVYVCLQYFYICLCVSMCLPLQMSVSVCVCVCLPGPPTGVTRLGSPASPRIVPVDAAACRAYPEESSLGDPGGRKVRV